MKKLISLFSCLFVVFSGIAQNTDEQLGIQYFQQGEYNKAVEMFEKSYNKQPNSYIYYYYYQTLIELGDYKELEKLAKKQIRNQPNVQRFKVDLGYAYERANEGQKAQKEYENTIKNLPANENVIRELFNAFLARGKREYAIQALQRGRKLLGNDKAFSSELTSVLLALGQTDKVIEEAMSLISGEDHTLYVRQAETIIQDLLADDENDQHYLAVRSILLRNVQKYPSNNAYTSLLFWIYRLHKDYPAALILAKSVDKREKGSGQIIFNLAREAALNKDYSTAIEALNFIIQKGNKSDYYTMAQFELLNVKYAQLTSVSPVRMADALLLEKEFQKILNENGLHSGTLEWLRKYAHLLAFYTDKPEQAIALLNEGINISNKDLKEKAVLKVDLADVLLYSDQVWDATLLYSQVDKEFPNDTIGQLAKFKNAKLSFYIGEFKWAKSQLDVLRSATTRLIANDAMYFSLLISDNENEDEDEDEELLFSEKQNNIPLRYFAKADFLRFQNKDNAALIMLDSVLMVDPFGKLADDVYYQKAQIAIRQKQYLMAEEQLKKLLQSHSYDILGDDATYLLAELYEYYLKDIPKAMEYYQKLMKDYPSSIYVVDARKRFRALRGDNL